MLTGIYANETEVIEIDGVKFKVGLLPPSIHRKIQSRLAQFKGMNEDEIVRSGKLDDLLECYEDTVKWAVKGHDGYKDKDGKEIPFKSVREFLKAEGVDVVARDLLVSYYYSGVINTLGPRVFEKSTLSGQEAKNSDAPSA